MIVWRLHALLRVVGEILKFASKIPRIGKILIFKALHRSDNKRWVAPDSLETWWDTRTEKMARFIPNNTRIIEFGAGRRQLEKLLDPSCGYIPSDLVDRGPGTVICDLNQRPLPDLRYLGADMTFFAGVLEYIRDVESVMNWLSKQFSYCVASYTCVLPTRNIIKRFWDRLNRLYYGYMNNYTEEELLELFKKHGFVCSNQGAWTSQRIYLFTNQGNRQSTNNHKKS